MTFFKRIFLFVLTNILVVATISIVSNLLMGFFGVRMNSGTAGLLIFCSIWGFSGAFISLFLSKFMAKMMMRVQVIDANVAQPELRHLVQTVHALARRAGIEKMPEVGIYESPEVNAFATGPSKNNSLVAVSSGLLQRMTPDEVEGVLGHEIAHVANGDMVTMTLIQGVVNSFAMFLSRILASVIASNSDSRNRHMIQYGLVFVFDILFTILGSVVVAAFSRYREFRADAGGAQYAGKQKMISALQRLQSQIDRIDTEQKAYATLKISDKPSSILSLFSTHPPLSLRIERLQNASHRT